jgi:hypothetical protein
MTDAQLRLVAHLTRIIRDEPEERVRRWGVSADLAARYAVEGRLLLAREWTADLVLDASGTVIVKDTENGQPDAPANPTETKLALFTAIEVYPELLSFLPQRPAEASTCTSCGGTGVLEGALVNPKLRNVRCECFGAGWISLPTRIGG